MFEELDRVELKDGRIGCILEVFEDAYLIEFATPDGPHAYDDEFVPFEDVASKASD